MGTYTTSQDLLGGVFGTGYSPSDLQRLQQSTLSQAAAQGQSHFNPFGRGIGEIGRRLGELSQKYGECHERFSEAVGRYISSLKDKTIQERLDRIFN